MRILHYTTTYAPAWKWGGPPRSVSSLCEGLAELGHEVTVFTTDAGLEADHTLLRGAPVTRDGVTVHYFPAHYGAMGITSEGLGRAVATRLGDFDLVNLCGAWQPANRLAVLAAQRTGIPYIISPRGMLQRYSFSQRPWRKWVWYWLVERGMLRRAAAIHCTSRLEAEEVGRFRLRTPRWVVPNVVSLQSWRRDEQAGRRWRERLGISPGELVLLYAGRLHHKKGLDLLPPVLRHWNGSERVHLVLAGPDEDGSGARLRHSMAQAGLGDRITLPGHLDTPQLQAAYSGADVFVLPSRDENFGNVVVEAIACGCHAVVTDTVGVAAELAGLNSVRVVPREVKLWVEAIGQLRNESATAISRAASARWLDRRFSRTGVAEAMARRYRAVVDGWAHERLWR